MKRKENRCNIDNTAYWWPTDIPLLLVKREKSWLLEEADRLRSQIMLPSLGAGSSSITCACELISGQWGGALSRLLCACSHVEGTCLGAHSELNPRTIESSYRSNRTRTRHGRVFKSSNLKYSLALSLSLSLSLGNFYMCVG